MLLVKLPVPLPSVVWLLMTVGLWLVLQQTPLAVTVALPSCDTWDLHSVPPGVTPHLDEVVTVGNDTLADVVNVRSSP